MVQATLPHSKPRSHEFERVNGRYSLHVHAPPSIGLPYGSYPRLVLTWMCTEAVTKKRRELYLGDSFSDFMYRLGLTPIGGKRGTTPRLREQLHRLFSTTVRWSNSDERHGRASGRAHVIAGEHHLCWSPADPAQSPTWASRVSLSRDFFEEVTETSIPVDLRTLRLLQRSPLALDIYAWLTYRMSYLRKPCRIPWPGLRGQFGAEYSRPRDFRRRFVTQLGAVLRLYSDARVYASDEGLLLYPSPTHVAPSSRAR